MADRPDVSMSKILASLRARTPATPPPYRREADRQIAQILLYAIWLRDGRGANPPGCERGLLSYAEHFAGLYPEALRELTRALALQGLIESAEACRVLCGFAEVQTVH